MENEEKGTGAEGLPSDRPEPELQVEEARDGSFEYDGAHRGYDRRHYLLIGGAVLLIALLAAGAVWIRRDSSTKTGVAGGTTTTSSGPATCGYTTWPKIYQGEPANLAGATDTGFYVWIDLTGWHIRGIDTSGAAPFTISVTTSSAATDAKHYHAVPADAGTVEVSGNVATQTFRAGPTPKGMDFSPCAGDVQTFRVNLSTNNIPWPPEKIWIGSSANAVTNPLVIQRR